MLLPDDVTAEEAAEIRAPSRPPMASPSHILRTPGGQPPIFREHGTATQARALVRLDHGRWVVDCPFCPCADFAFDEYGNWLEYWKCPPLPEGCENSAAGKRRVEVAHPSTQYARKIMAILNLRPDEANRNWTPGETLGHLRRENAAHGLPTEPGKVALL